MEFELVFIRHGETTGNVTHETHCEEIDFLLELTEKGREQAREVQKLIEGEVFDSVFSSDMIRTKQTTEIIFGETAVIHFDKRLREAYLSTNPDFVVNYEEMPKKERVHMRLVGFDGGETFVSQVERMRSFIDMVLTGEYGYKIAIVTHAGGLRSVDCVLRGMSLEEALWAKKTGNCGIRRIQVTKDNDKISVFES